MTREEAIEILKDDVMCQSGWVNQLCGNSKKIAKGRIKAHEMAIEALKAEPCEDCVRRSSVLACEQNIWDDCGVVSVEDIKALPSVTPTRKKGKWIVKIVGKPESGGTLGKYICDQCQKAIWAIAIEGEPNFCPNCGAEMREGDEK